MGEVPSKDLIRQARQAQDALYRLAREDFNVFAELVGRDDRTGQPIRQAPIHRRWNDLLNKHDRLIIWSCIETAKTTQISILRTVWKLGRDPNRRHVIISATAAQAEKLVKAVGNYINNNETVRAIFPELKPDFNGKWTNTMVTVERETQAKDPSLTGIGVNGAILGARIDDLVMDDILSEENCRTADQRQKVINWYKSTIIGRLTQDATVTVVGTAWHPGDLLHMLAKEPGFVWYRFPVINSKGQLSWPDNWNEDRIAKKKKDLGPLEFARQCLCKVRDDETARFKEEWFDKAKERGKDLEVLPELDEVPHGCAVYTGVDLSVGKKKTKKKKSDDTVLFTVLVHPNGDRQILNVEAGRWDGPQILKRLRDNHARYGGILIVEDVASQAYILQFATESDAIPVVPHTTSAAKWDPNFGVESIATELFNGKWIIPSKNGIKHPEIEKWIEECLFFSPDAHTGDRLMACYFVRERIRKSFMGADVPSVSMRVLGGSKDLVN